MELSVEFPYDIDQKRVRNLPMSAEKVESCLNFFDWDEQLVFPKERILLILESKFVLITHDDRFLRTDFLTETAKDASKHVDLEALRISLLLVYGLRCLNFDRERRTDPAAQTARNTTLNSIFFHEDRSPAE